MNKHHQVALAAAHRWAEIHKPGGGTVAIVAFGTGFADVYDVCRWQLDGRPDRNTVWQRIKRWFGK